MTHHKIIIEDCLQGMKLLDDESVDLVLTDPPFDIDAIEYDEVLKSCRRLMKENTAIYCYWSSKGLTYFEPIFREHFDLKNIISVRTKNFISHPWDKTAFDFKWTPIFFGVKGKLDYSTYKRCFQKGYDTGDAWECNMPQSNWKNQKKEHDWQKPEDTIRRMIRISSESGNTILDPFAGSFTTSKVAKDLKRNSISIEINPDYWHNIGKKRLRYNQPSLDNSISFEVIEL